MVLLLLACGYNASLSKIGLVLCYILFDLQCKLHIIFQDSFIFVSTSSNIVVWFVWIGISDNAIESYQTVLPSDLCG